MKSENCAEVLNVEGGGRVKMWTQRRARRRGRRSGSSPNVASMPFVHKHMAVMPDVHVGIGATVGSVVATKGAIIPAAVGVDLGCGMMAVKTTLKAERSAGLAVGAAPGHRAGRAARLVSDRDYALKGTWGDTPEAVRRAGAGWRSVTTRIVAKRPRLTNKEPHKQLGTLGGGNHFIEVCLDTEQTVWVMLHSGSRGIGNRIGQLFIELARKDMEALHQPAGS